VVSKDEWDTKEGPGKSMKNTLCIQRHGKKAPFGLKQPQTAKNQALSVKLCKWKIMHKYMYAD